MLSQNNTRAARFAGWTGMSALRRLNRSAAAGADVPKEQNRGGESEPEMKVAGGVPPIFVA